MNRSGRAAHLDLVTPDLFVAGGGIARISRALALACHHWCAEREVSLRVHALGDSGLDRDERYLPSPSIYRGYGGSRAALGWAVLRSAAGAGHIGTVFTHVNLALLGLGFAPRSPGWPSRYAIVIHLVEICDPRSRRRRWALQRAQALWTVSRHTARTVTERHPIDPLKLRVIPNCLDPHWSLGSEPAPEPPRSAASAPLFLLVARLSAAERYKGADHTIEALGRAADRLPSDARLVIVGDGDDRVRLQRLAASQGVASRIEFRRCLSEAALEELYRRCLAFVLPSQSEGFGLVFVEAMARARPVIAARSAAAPEVVVDGQTGLLVPYGDVAALAQAMVDLAASPARAAELGRRGLERVRERFVFTRYRADIAAALSSLWGT